MADTVKGLDHEMDRLTIRAARLGLISPRISINDLPEWIELRETIYQALLPYPEARFALAEALFKIGASPQPRQEEHDEGDELITDFMAPGHKPIRYENGRKGSI